MAGALALAGAGQALEDTMAYLRERTAFGEPLSQRQALRHRLADLATEMEAARRLLYHAAELYAAGEECVMEVSMAKLFATEVANRVAYHAVQLAGTATCASSRSRVFSATSGSTRSPPDRRRSCAEIIARRLPL